VIPILSLVFSWVSPSLAWFTFGFTLFLFELVTPGFFLFFFGVGAWLVSLVQLVSPEGALNHVEQLALFITSSVVCLALFRSRLSELLNRETNEASALVEQEQVGRRVSVVRAISPDHPGRVLVHGVEWSARSDEALAEGEVAEVVGRESITLVVRRAPPRGQA